MDYTTFIFLAPLGQAPAVDFILSDESRTFDKLEGPAGSYYVVTHTGSWPELNSFIQTLDFFGGQLLALKRDTF